MAGKRKAESTLEEGPKRLKITLEEHSPDRNEGVFEMLPTELIEMLTHSLDLIDRMKLLRVSKHSRELFLNTGLFHPPNNTSQNYRSDFSHFFLLSSQLHDWKPFWFYSSELTSSDRHELFQSSSFLHQLKLYRILTFAGTGKRGYSGDGGKAIHAQLVEPQNVLHRRDGSVIIAEEYRIRSVDIHGNISTLARNPTQCQVNQEFTGQCIDVPRLLEPSGLAEGKDGTLFALDAREKTVISIKGTESVVIVSGNTRVADSSTPEKKTMRRYRCPLYRPLVVKEDGTLLLSDIAAVFKLENGLLHPIVVNQSLGSDYFLACDNLMPPLVLHHSIKTICEIEGISFLVGVQTFIRVSDSNRKERIWTSPSSQKIEYAKAAGGRIYFTDSISVKVLDNLASNRVYANQITGDFIGERDEKEGGPASDTPVYFTAGLDVNEELGKIWFVEQKRNVIRVLEAWFDVA